ncbi:DUF6519 domain-containing protein, partial [Pseudomonadota bacterium]
MKAQISRDSFKEEKQYSAVYQQQGRMITDADWNEMVRILKQRMDRTVGAAIESGSPKEGGILRKDATEWEWSSPKEPFKVAKTLNSGRIYVDGMYGEICTETNSGLGHPIDYFLKQQKDFPENPADKLADDAYYVAYIDLWERLVIALEDEKLKDPALHGADTCVRTQTMSQFKLAKLKAADPEAAIKEVETEWEAKLAGSGPMINMPLWPCGLGYLSSQSASNSTGSAVHNCDTSERENFNQKNTLLRIEVHDTYTKDGKDYLVLKWSMENGAEQHSNEPDVEFPDIPNFWGDEHVYECFSDVTEKHLGQHLMEGFGDWAPQRGELYGLNAYKDARKNANNSPAKKMDYVRRWDGYLTLKKKSTNTKAKWELDESASVINSNFSVSQGEYFSGAMQILVLENTALKFELYLLTSIYDMVDLFMPGDYWLTLLRDQGKHVSAEVLSPSPVGIYHHYMVLGVYTKNKPADTGQDVGKLFLTPAQWRRLSFSSLTNLTLDRVLVEDKEGNEISVEDKFVDVDGDTMTGP